MKNIFFYLLIINLISIDLQAQKMNNELSINAEIGTSENGFALGFFGKYAYGIGKSSQLTFSAGITSFSTILIKEDEPYSIRIIPFLAGYKHNFKRFFVEPQIGIGSLSGKVNIGGDVAKPSVAAAFGGIGAGYSFNSKLNIGVRFLAAHGIENTSAGLWNNKNFNYTSLLVGYNIFRSKNK